MASDCFAFLAARAAQPRTPGATLLPVALETVYVAAMIAVKAENNCVQVTIPTDGMTPEDVNDFVSWLRDEAIVRRSKLTPEAAWQLSEDIKSGWWQANEKRFTPPGAE